ncbi:hypothetical protein MTO96_016422 [Rhipicephalus appendiculatus]
MYTSAMSARTDNVEKPAHLDRGLRPSPWWLPQGPRPTADDSGRTCGSSAGKRWASSKSSAAATTGGEAPVSGRVLSAERGRLLVAEQQERGLWAAVVPCEAIRRQEARCSGACPRPSLLRLCTLGSRSEDRRLEGVFLRQGV